MCSFWALLSYLLNKHSGPLTGGHRRQETVHLHPVMRLVNNTYKITYSPSSSVLPRQHSRLQSRQGLWFYNIVTKVAEQSAMPTSHAL